MAVICITRRMYMAGPHTGAEGDANHRAYYGQFVSLSLRSYVGKAFGVGRLRAALAQDEHLNNIPLEQWDRMAYMTKMGCADDLQMCGDNWSMAGSVCILKEAARQAVEADMAEQVRLSNEIIAEVIEEENHASSSNL